ncbi:FadR/GntR family transcriptional regulator [Propionivibrio sp.]|uniref:FadR/GntR family transcriptional regulator n=1 Tax=Propionivibrio sp. TaxID=2212460 RepID=UPI0039E2BB3D
MTSIPEFKVERITLAGTLTDRVFDALTQLINGGDFKPGTRLPSELDMADRFGVSRTVIREAVSRLKSEGLVESRQGSGVFVRDRNMHTPFRIDPTLMDSIESVQQVVELRLSLEGEIAALAATRRTRAQMAAIKRALKQIELAEQAGKDGVEADIEFHRSIAEATGNPHFLALIKFLSNFLIKATLISRSHEATKATLLQQVRDEHQRIVDAISQQDPAAARLAARQHMEGASRRLGSVDIGRFPTQNGQNES